jgi:hypothetical protein
VTDQFLSAKIAAEAKDNAVRGVAPEKLSDQALLAQLGMWVRPELTSRVTDQALLAQIVIEAKDWEVRQAAVEKLSDQALLAKIALEDVNSGVRYAAVDKLTDQVLLAKVAVESVNSSVRRAAVEKLSDQALLAKVAVEDEYWSVRAAAVEKLSDQAVLAKIAVEDTVWEIRYAAVGNKNLTNQTVLAEVAVEDVVWRVRVAAIGKVTDWTVLRQWFEKCPQAAIRQSAVVGIMDDGFLVSCLAAEPSDAVRTTMIETLHGKEALCTVALTAYHQHNRELALRLLKEKFKDPAADVAAAHNQLKSRVTALTAETDNNKLLELALKGEFDVLRSAAARRLTDPVVLEQIALQADDRIVLKIVLAKLEDKEILNRLASNASDLPLRLAAAKKSGSKSWQDIFSVATARGAGEQQLGDALAAVSLFPAVQDDAKYGVQQACLNLIRRGDESRIPEMADLLEGYGDKTLAEDYLNCGQPDLDSAGRSWANKRGYNIGKGSGSHRANWGSGQ